MNVMTQAMEKLTDMLYKSDATLKKMGAEPYGMRKLTPTEQRKAFENLTPQSLNELINEHGVDDVNEWLSKFMPKEVNNA